MVWASVSALLIMKISHPGRYWIRDPGKCYWRGHGIRNFWHHDGRPLLQHKATPTYHPRASLYHFFVIQSKPQCGQLPIFQAGCKALSFWLSSRYANDGTRHTSALLNFKLSASFHVSKENCRQSSTFKNRTSHCDPWNAKPRFESYILVFDSCQWLNIQHPAFSATVWQA